MNKIKSIWHGELPKYPEQSIEQIKNAAAPEQSDICCCFYLFRYLHETPTPGTTLAGDYCFARFSKHLSALDSVPLNDAFAAYLRRDAVDGGDTETYLDFVRMLPAVTAHES